MRAAPVLYQNSALSFLDNSLASKPTTRIDRPAVPDFGTVAVNGNISSAGFGRIVKTRQD